MKALPLVLALCASPIWPDRGATEEAPAFLLGVQTHFQQRWDLELIDAARDLGAPAIRDEVGWRDVESAAGIYDFSIPDSYMKPLLANGMTPLIVITDSNPIYDEGKTPNTDEGRAALSRFVSAMLSHYGPEAIRIEIGNEVNSSDFVDGPFARDSAAYFAAQVRQVRSLFDADHPQVKLTCAGLNTIGIGYFREFFRRGGLQSCDAISVHPYREHPETLGEEMARLRALMREYGGEKPVVVTEFGKWFKDAQEAPDYMVKMVAEMSASGVSEAYWYALRDEEWWPNMGLLEETGQAEKPAAAAFRFLQETLLPIGAPVAVDTEGAVRLFSLGMGGRGYMAWGSAGRLKVEGQAKYFDTRGMPIEATDSLSDSPVVILGEGLTVTVKREAEVADTQYQFNQPPWSYYALRPEPGLTPLEIVDSDWTSFRSAPDLSPLRIGEVWITTARFQGEPFHAVERFTARTPGLYRIEGWWEASEKSEPSELIVLHNRKPLLTSAVTPKRLSVAGLSLRMEAGDTVDFEVAPGGPNGDGSVRRRIKVIGPADPG